MKTLTTAAKAAIVAGEAIVTGAVEIVPLNTASYTLIDTVDVDAVTNADGSLSNAMAVGVTLSGFSPSDTFRLTLPSGEFFTAWNYQVGTANRWLNEFDIVPDGVSANSFRVSQLGASPSSGAHTGGYATADLARAAFGSHLISGASDYTFWIMDTAAGGGSGTFNNSDGVSVRVEKQFLIDGGTALRLWGGHGTLAIAGNDFAGVGDRAMAQQTSGAIGGIAQGMTLGLSGIEPALLALMDDAEQFKAASVVIYRLIFAADGKTLLDAHVFDRGRLDTIASDEIVGAGATISAAVESTARSLGRSLARLRSDSDQRLIDALDGYFKQTAYAWQKELYWGGKKPSRTASAVGGASAPGGSGASAGSAPASSA